MRFGLLWTDVADEVCTGYLAILGDLGLLDEGHGACAFNLFGDGAFEADAMGRSWPHLLVSSCSQIDVEGPRRSF
jgi:hypothetical protein